MSLCVYEIKTCLLLRGGMPRAGILRLDVYGTASELRIAFLVPAASVPCPRVVVGYRLVY